MQITLEISDEMIDKLADAFVLRIKQSMGSVDEVKQRNKWMTHVEASAYIRKTQAALYKLTSDRKIRYSKRGKSNYYLLENLDKYLGEGELLTKEEIGNAVHLQPKYIKHGR